MDNQIEHICHIMLNEFRNEKIFAKFSCTEHKHSTQYVNGSQSFFMEILSSQWTNFWGWWLFSTHFSCG